MAERSPSRLARHRTGQAYAERSDRKLQRPPARGVPERTPVPVSAPCLPHDGGTARRRHSPSAAFEPRLAHSAGVSLKVRRTPKHEQSEPVNADTKGSRSKAIKALRISRGTIATPLNALRVLPQCFHAGIGNAYGRPEAECKIFLCDIFGCGRAIWLMPNRFLAHSQKETLRSNPDSTDSRSLAQMIENCSV